MIVGDVESMDLTALGRDAIVFGDILEHLRNPKEVLQRVSALLKPGGKVLISLPNVANIWVRLNLSSGVSTILVSAYLTKATCGFSLCRL